MPMYEYSCNDCLEKFKKYKSMKDQSVVECPKCSGKDVKREFSTFSSGDKQKEKLELEQRLQQKYDEIKTDLKEHKKELKEKVNGR